MKLSDQAQGALMMALQKCLVEQRDIVPILASLEFAEDDLGCLVVENPPTFQVSGEMAEKAKPKDA